MSDKAHPDRPQASRRILRWMTGFVLGCVAGPLVLYMALKGLQPAGILELTLVTDENRQVRVIEASFAGWPLTIDYAADGAVRFRHERTRRRSGELRLTVDVPGARHTLTREIDLTPLPMPEWPGPFQQLDEFGIPKIVPVCRVVARASPNALIATPCLSPSAY